MTRPPMRPYPGSLPKILLWSSLPAAALWAQDTTAQQLTPTGPSASGSPEDEPVPLESIDVSPHLPGAPLWITITLGLLVLVLTVALLRFLQKRSRDNVDAEVSPLTALTIARSRMQALHDQTESASLAEVATRVSLTVRQYLADAQSEVALYQTHEEFNASEQRLQRLPMEPRQEVTTFLQELADVQYASDSGDGVLAKSFVVRGLETLETISRSSQLAPLADD